MNDTPYRLLHVGCGHKTRADLPPPFCTPDWQEIRLDIDPSTAPDIVASITDMREIESASVEGLWSAHNIEHLFPHEVPLALGEFFRVLSATGFAVVTVPDLEAVAEQVAKHGLHETAYISPAGPIAPIDILYGFRPALAAGYHYMAHRTGFTAASLRQALEEAGFLAVTVRRDPVFALWAVASRSGVDADATGIMADDIVRRVAATHS